MNANRSKHSYTFIIMASYQFWGPQFTKTRLLSYNGGLVVKFPTVLMTKAKADCFPCWLGSCSMLQLV